jgi:ATP-dependent DNA ligase
MAAKVKGRFIHPMLLLRTDSLPNDGSRWEYQLKFDGHRAIAFKTSGKIHLRSRNDNDFSLRYPGVMKGLAKLPDETVIDGEVIAVGEEGRRRRRPLQTKAHVMSEKRAPSHSANVHLSRDPTSRKSPREARY